MNTPHTFDTPTSWLRQRNGRPWLPLEGSRGPLIFREAPLNWRSLHHTCGKLGGKPYVPSGLGIPTKECKVCPGNPREHLPWKQCSPSTQSCPLLVGMWPLLRWNLGGVWCSLLQAHTWVLTLTSFPEECSPSLATDAQDQATEHDDRGKLHPKTESQADTTKHEAGLPLFLVMLTYPSLPKINSTQSYISISISICIYRWIYIFNYRWIGCVSVLHFLFF